MNPVCLKYVLSGHTGFFSVPHHTHTHRHTHTTTHTTSHGVREKERKIEREREEKEDRDRERRDDEREDKTRQDKMKEKKTEIMMWTDAESKFTLHKRKLNKLSKIRQELIYRS